MDIKYFRLIKTITEEGNIANSSEKLFLTQSALSHQLKELESRLGFKVFHRTRNRWELTEEGQELHALGISVLRTIEKGFGKIEEIRTGSKGKVRLSTECYSFYQGMSGFIQKMGILYPDIEVDLVLEATLQPLSKISASEIDIAIVTAKPANQQLKCIELFQDEIYAVMHKENPLSKLDFIEASAFAEEHLIIHSFPLETVSVCKQFLIPNNISPQKISAIPLTEVALEMVGANMGITCLPKWALKSFILSDDIVLKQIGPNGLKRSHYMIVREEDKNKKYISDFMLNLEEDFSKK